MNVVSKVVTTSAKSALLATILLIVYLLSYQGESFDIIPMVLFIGYIITFIISIGMIITTLLPFYSFSKSKDMQKIFNYWFPYYAILFFVLLIIFTGVTDITNEFISFPMIAFITAMQAWVWFFKEQKNEKKEAIN